MKSDKMKKSLFLTLIAIFALLATTSCGKDNDTSFTVPSDAIWAIVTMEETGSNGTTFTFCKNGDSQTITLTSPKNLSNLGLPAKARVLIAYKPVEGIDPYKSGPITLYGTAFLNGTLTFTGSALKYNGFKSDPITVTALTRAGEYINLTASALYYRAPKLFLVIDETTVDNEYPDAYIICNNDDIINSATHIIYGSFSIASVWQKPSCKGIRVHYTTYSGSNIETFNKGPETIRPAE